MMLRLVLISIALAALPGCSTQREDLKSPCVGTDDSPCVRRPVNDWWHHPDNA